MLQVAGFIEIRWATPHRLYVIISGKYQGRTQGLCGNFNGAKEDDNLSPQGSPLKSDLEFGQSWAVKDGNANFRLTLWSCVYNFFIQIFENIFLSRFKKVFPSYTLCSIVHMQPSWVLSNSAKQLLA